MLGLIYDTQYTVQISPINKSNTRTLLLRILNLIVKGEVSRKKSQHINLYNSFLSNTVSIQKKTSITLLHLKKICKVEHQYSITVVPGQGCVLHSLDSECEPIQGFPPCCGTGLVQVRIRT